ncbi:MAG: acetyl-CoA acetyltransferase [Proteobacteria bacterium]|nr:acetyl-CoA acetyltransferase [Pseudomonadota bacterium]
MLDPRTPILVGGGQFTQRTAREGKLAESLSPIAMLEKVARLALADTGKADAVTRALDTVAIVRFTADSPGDQGRLPKRMFRNPPLSLAGKLGAKPRHAVYTATGGNTPQWLVNRTAEQIANGECNAALLAGAEYIATILGAMKQGFNLNWGQGEEGDPGRDPEEIGEQRAGTTEHERAYKLNFPVNAYPLFENALRDQAGRSPEAHLKWLGEFFSPFSKVASENPHAWFPTYRSPAEISTPSEKNRFVGFPYTKYLNAVIEVDMAAAVVMTSVAKARELGIPESKWVFLHGCGDASDIWFVSERVNYHSSPAIRTIGQKAFSMARKTVSDLAFIDLYSCFPSAVEIGCRELGIAPNDLRGLTITGGLPYFGGAGNNYVMHSIVTMMDKLRAAPGKFGLCTANGWYVTKHSAGIYSTTPFEGRWQREDPKSYQKDIDAMPHPELVEKPNGRGKIETYTVVTDRKAKRFGIVVGRLEDGRRFLANTLDDNQTLHWMMREEVLGHVGTVTADTPTNQFRFA